MSNWDRVFAMPFAQLYPSYVAKVERKGHTQEELDEIIRWLTGYDAKGLQKVLDDGTDVGTFFAQAPKMNPNTHLITGVVCGVRVEEIDDPKIQQVRWLDKLVDELARGKKFENILRSPAS